MGQISEVLEEMKDWQTLADKLGIESSKINYITTTCDIATSAPAECQRRMLVRAFCNQQGLVEVENIAENIAKILEVMKKPLLAAKLRRMYPVKSKLTSIILWYLCIGIRGALPYQCVIVLLL